MLKRADCTYRAREGRDGLYIVSWILVKLGLGVIVQFKYLILSLSLFCSSRTLAQAPDDPSLYDLRDVVLRLNIARNKACIPVYADADQTKVIQCLKRNAAISTLISREIDQTPGTTDPKAIEALVNQISSDENSVQKITVEAGYNSKGRAIKDPVHGYINLRAASRKGAIQEYIGEDVGSYAETNLVRDLFGPPIPHNSIGACPGALTESVSSMKKALCGSIFKCYSNDPKVQKMIAYARAHVTPRPRGKRKPKPMCFRAVKTAMVKSDMTDDYIRGGDPKNSDTELSKQGYKNLLDDPDMKDLIKSPNDGFAGALFVYDSIPHDRKVWTKDDKGKSQLVPDPGHIEIKSLDSGQGGFVSDYYSINARTGDQLSVDDKRTHRKLIGVYYKADIEKACEAKAAAELSSAAASTTDKQ